MKNVLEKVIRDTANLQTTEGVRLVRGSHIVTRKLFDHDRGYFFQGTDNRIIFAIPYEDDFTLIGTTDQDHEGAPGDAVCTDAEVEYLCQFASEYFQKPITTKDVVWRYSGVRPLYDDGAKSATEATRDYVLSLDEDGAPLLNVFGGKITTYRRLSEAVLAKLSKFTPTETGKWTAGVALPGGDFPVNGVGTLISELCRDYPFLDDVWARRLVRGYGTEAREILGDAKSQSDLGQAFGASLTAAEVDWMMQHEFALTTDDVLWRRTRLGLHIKGEHVQALADYMASKT